MGVGGAGVIVFLQNEPGLLFCCSGWRLLFPLEDHDASVEAEADSVVFGVGAEPEFILGQSGAVIFVKQSSGLYFQHLSAYGYREATARFGCAIA